MKLRLKQVRGVVRRMVIVHFRKGYLEEQLRRRKGECLQCGKCCELAMKCVFLSKTGRCLVYYLWRPLQCKSFPMDERDLDEVGGTCGYYFEERGGIQ